MSWDVSLCAIGNFLLLLDASRHLIFFCPLIHYSLNELCKLLLVGLSNLNTVLNQLIDIVFLVGVEFKRLVHDLLEAVVVLVEDLPGKVVMSVLLN